MNEFLNKLKLHGKFVRIQPWTLLWETPADRERALSAVPEAKDMFINLVRSELDKRVATSEV